MPDSHVTVYDDILYPGDPRPQTHPDRLATLATLFGMTPAPLDRCRVLELGCGDGGNLIPMAFGLPVSTFVGLDLAERPIAAGRQSIQALGLSNISLEARDIQEISPDFGQFDYIIAHGLMSWVPPDVQEKIFAICRENLTPHGVAYISYNTFPGCRPLQMIREMMRFHIRPLAQAAQAREQMREAREFLRFLAGACSGPEIYPQLLRREMERIAGLDQHLFYHDDLADINIPFYFHEFTERAARHGLQFLAEANIVDMQDEVYAPEVTDTLRAWAGDSVVVREQYLDFIKNRRFRQTLLCRSEVALERRLDPRRLTAFRVASQAQPTVPRPDLHSQKEVEFRGKKGIALVCDLPLAKAALSELGTTWPASLPLAELVSRARILLGRASSPDSSDPESQGLGEVLVQCFRAGLVELHLAKPAFAQRAGKRPVSSPVARLQIRSGAVSVTNLCHGPVIISEALSRELVLLLDGTRDRADLLRDLTALAVSGAAALQIDGQTLTDPAAVGRMLASGLEPSLSHLAKMALLVS
jgi:methyltransferase-like protein/trans-aconitate methyltransferase